MAQEKLGVSCELIDLQTILPWDVETVCKVTDTRVMLKSQQPEQDCILWHLFAVLVDQYSEIVFKSQSMYILTFSFGV